MKLLNFINEIERKPFKKSLDVSDLTLDEFNKYYDLGREGVNPYDQFYESYLSLKIDIYVNQIVSGTNHRKALQKSNLDQIEFDQFKSTIDEMILDYRIEIVMNEILNDQTTEIAAKHAGVSFDDIYDWYYKGKSDDKFKEFSEFFYNHYMEPNLLYFNEMVLEGKPIELLLKIFEDDFTNKDFKIWQEEGLIEKEDIVVNLDENKYDNDEEIFVSGSGLNPELYGFINNIEDSDDEALEQFFDFYNIKKPNSPSSILRNDFEER